MKKRAANLLRSINPNDVADQFPKGAIKLMTRIIPPKPVEPPGKDYPMVLIEGDALSLEYFGKWVLAQAGFLLDCGVGIGPRGRSFDQRAEVGIYVHRVPCMNPPAQSKKGTKSVRRSARPSKRK